MEIWKDVVGYEKGYKVSSLGRLFCKKREMVMRLKKDRYGYLCAMLRNGKKRGYPTIHRLVAIAFLENKENKLHVNHINNIRDDNRLINLEWATPQENTNHAMNFGNLKVKGEDNFFYGKRGVESMSYKHQSKLVLDLQTGIYYENSKIAAEAKDIKWPTVRAKLNGYRRNNINLLYV